MGYKVSVPPTLRLGAGGMPRLRARRGALAQSTLKRAPAVAVMEVGTALRQQMDLRQQRPEAANGHPHIQLAHVHL